MKGLSRFRRFIFVNSTLADLYNHAIPALEKAQDYLDGLDGRETPKWILKQIKEAQMNEQKYIIVKKNEFELPIVFNSFLDHSSVAGNETVVSAGFCTIDLHSAQFSAYGESKTLNVQSRGNDVDILNTLLIESF
jgi:hypothetical protein